MKSKQISLLQLKLPIKRGFYLQKADVDDPIFMEWQAYQDAIWSKDDYRIGSARIYFSTPAYIYSIKDMQRNDPVYRLFRDEGDFLDFCGYQGKKLDREQMYRLTMDTYKYNSSMFSDIERIIIAFGGFEFRSGGQYDAAKKTIYLNIPAFYENGLNAVKFAGVLVHEAMHNFTFHNFAAELKELGHYLAADFVQQDDRIIREWNYSNFNLAQLFSEYMGEIARLQYLMQTDYATDLIKKDYLDLIDSFRVAIQEIPRYITADAFLRYIWEQVKKELQ